MVYILSVSLLGILIMIPGFAGADSRRSPLPRGFIPVLFAAAAVLRLLMAALFQGFGSDTACFAAWADRIFQVGPGNFYSSEVFTDYPPGYMYILWLIGGLRSLLHLEYYSAAHLLLLKLPSIAADMICGWLLFREARRRLGERSAFFLCLAFLFHPAIILNSSVWGQVDSLFTLTVLLMCLSLIRGKMLYAYIAFGAGLLIKPQMLLFSPVLLAGILDQVFQERFSVKKLGYQLILGISAAAGALILCLPFGAEKVWNQYFGTIASYPYAAVNACNLWGFLGLNWVGQDNTFLGIPYRLYGAAAIAAVIVLLLLFSIRNQKSREKYPFLGALLILSIFVFSVRMHERYLYPGLLLLLFAYVYRPDRRLYLCYGVFSLLHFLNTADVLFFYDPADYDRKSPFILAVSGGMLIAIGLLYHTAFRLRNGNPPLTPPPCPLSREGKKAGDFSFRSLFFTGRPPEVSRRSSSPKPADILCMTLITLVYGCFALHNLGDRQAPSSSCDMVQNQSAELDFGGESPAVLWYYMAPWDHRTFGLEGRKESGGDWESLGEITLNNVFTWQSLNLENGMTQLRFTLQDTQASLLEWVFLNEEGEILTPSCDPLYENLFDEAVLFPRNRTFSAALFRIAQAAGIRAELLPRAGSFQNSMYFDEIYHGRTAYEFLHGKISYENTHPPLGKILISLGIALFGMNPFGWRITGTFLGILMVPAVYLFARRLWGRTSLAALACTLFAFDFMHFTQTRIATIDVYITFFVILMYYFMYQYSTLSFYDTSLKRTFLPLGACGICMGLGAASKWTGVYAGIGLALIFFSVLYRRYREYLYARQDPEGSTEGISHRHILDSFLPGAGRTVLFCLVFFVLVPALIYLLSYIPFRDYTDKGLLTRMFDNQTTMFQYHSKLEATHYFSSPWYEWPAVVRPIWFHSHPVTQTPAGGLQENISSFGNPAVWWAGIPAVLWMVYLWAKKKDRTAAFLTTGYLAQYLPWFFVTRITFIYHYFPSVVFAVLMIVHGFSRWKNKKLLYPVMVLYGGTVFALFLLFYPVLSGKPADSSFVEQYLRWFKSWVLIAQ